MSSAEERGSAGAAGLAATPQMKREFSPDNNMMILMMTIIMTIPEWKTLGSVYD